MKFNEAKNIMDVMAFTAMRLIPIEGNSDSCIEKYTNNLNAFVRETFVMFCKDRNIEKIEVE